MKKISIVISIIGISILAFFIYNYFYQKKIITSKFIVVDGNSMNYCSHEINPFSKMDIHDCSFSLENKNYHIRDKYFFDTKGMLHEYWTYLPEGPLTYSLEQLNSDPKFFESIGGKNLSVELIGDKIIDGIDTLKIERILQSEGLIFVIDKMELRKRGKRSIYQYE